jgi:hypothetical protein
MHTQTVESRPEEKEGFLYKSFKGITSENWKARSIFSCFSFFFFVFRELR